jgi:hypothetical protein
MERKILKGRNDLKTYFGKVLELANSGEAFPVDLDDVWSLVYGRKREAVRALKETGMKGVDYQVLRKNAQNTSTDYQSGGRPLSEYFISVSCMEWLIARKVRAVFDVYRRVFHLVAGGRMHLSGEGFRGCDYARLLSELGMSRRSGSFWRRIRRYPTEFRCTGGVWAVSMLMAGLIRSQAGMRRMYVELAEKRERYLSGQLSLPLWECE